MAVSALAVANAFLDKAENEGKTLTNMQLQKLVYIAHGCMLAVHDRPLYRERTEAWPYGPVIPDLYEPLRQYGRGKVAAKLATPDELSEEDQAENEIIDAVLDGYGHMDGIQLSQLTHKPHTPWTTIWEQKKFGEIKDELIRVCFNDLFRKAEKAQHATC